MSVSRVFRRFSYIIILLIALFCLFLLYISVTNYKPDEIVKIDPDNCKNANKKSGDTSLSFISWNIGYAGLGKEMDFFYDGGRRVRPYRFSYDKYLDGISKFIISNDSIDFLLIQEIDIRSKRSFYVDQFTELDKSLSSHCGYFAKNYDVKFVPVPVLSPMGKVKAGMATFSKLMASESFRFAFEGNYSWPKNLFMLDRCFILNRYELSNGLELVVINTHNSAFDDGNLREAQMQKLKEVMIEEYEKGNFVVAGGDWNLNPSGWSHIEVIPGFYVDYTGPKIAKDFFPEGWIWAYDKSLPTNRDLIESYFKGRTSTTLIDFFILSPNVALESVETINLGFENSDHHPVIMEIALKDFGDR